MTDSKKAIDKDAAKAEDDDDDIVELIRAVLYAAVLALTIRTFLVEPFNIPSGSMLPTLQVGDYLFVEKYSYGYSQYSFPFGVVRFDGRFFERKPERGDIIVFRKPHDTSIDYIKRLIGLPGDAIQVKNGVLHINDKAVTREYKTLEDYHGDGPFSVYRRYTESLPNGVDHSIYEVSDAGPLDDTPVFHVPEGTYFMMGDNRDGSQDSRVQTEVGFVPAENLIGRAAFIFFSTEGLGDKCQSTDNILSIIASLPCKLVEWPKAIRFRRFFRSVYDL